MTGKIEYKPGFAVTGGSQLQNTFGALYRVAVIPPLRYSINNVSIQKNYLFLTN